MTGDEYMDKAKKDMDDLMKKTPPGFGWIGNKLVPIAEVRAFDKAMKKYVKENYKPIV